MEKISKMVYMAPVTAIVPMQSEGLLHKALSYVDHGDGKKDRITTVNEDNENLNLSKDWGLDWEGCDDSGFDWD